MSHLIILNYKDGKFNQKCRHRQFRITKDVNKIVRDGGFLDKMLLKILCLGVNEIINTGQFKRFLSSKMSLCEWNIVVDNMSRYSNLIQIFYSLDKNKPEAKKERKKERNKERKKERMTEREREREKEPFHFGHSRGVSVFPAELSKICITKTMSNFVSKDAFAYAESLNNTLQPHWYE